MHWIFILLIGIWIGSMFGFLLFIFISGMPDNE